MDCQLALMTGIDIPIEELQVNVHQPTIKEISYIGEENFFTALQYLTINKKNFIKDKAVLNQTSNFQLFCAILEEESDSNKKDSIVNLLTLLFPSYKIFFTPQSIILNKTDGTLIIDDNNFEIVQELIKKIFNISSSSNTATFNPQGKKAQEIADKIMKGRKRISEEKGDHKESVLSRYLSVLAIGNHQSLLELINLTIYQLYDQIERYVKFVNWDIDIQTRLAGAKNDKKPDSWMENIH